MSDFNIIISTLDAALNGLYAKSFKRKQVSNLVERINDLKVKHRHGTFSPDDVDTLTNIKNEIEILLHLWLFYNTDETLMTWLKPD